MSSTNRITTDGNPLQEVDAGAAGSSAPACSVTTDELRAIVNMERWKADNGPVTARSGFLARAAVIEQLIEEIESQNAPVVGRELGERTHQQEVRR